MFDLKEKIFEKYNESDKKKSLEQFRSDELKNIYSNIDGVAYNSIFEMCRERRWGSDIFLDLYGSLHIVKEGQYRFDIMVDKHSVMFNQRNRLNDEIYNDFSSLYGKIEEPNYNDLDFLENRIKQNVQNSIDIEFKKAN